MATGIKFNPYNTFGTLNSNGDPSEIDTSVYDDNSNVPIQVDDYFTPQSSVGFSNQMTNPPTKPLFSMDKETALERSRELSEMMDSSSKEEDYKTSLEKWDKGLAGLKEDEREEWEKENASKIEGKNEAYKDRLWKNQKFVEAAGIDVFHKVKDAKDRDTLYENYLVNSAIEQKFGPNNNIDQIQSLTPEGKKELLNSDYKSDVALNLENEELKDKSFWDLTGDEKAAALAANVKAGAGTGSFVGSILGGAATGGMGVLPGIVIGTGVGILGGAAATVADASYSKDAVAANNKIKNQYILDKVIAHDNERKKESVKDEAAEIYRDYLTAYHNGELSKEEIDKKFDSIALNSDTNAGSNYYSAFKDTDEFEKFNTTDKLRQIAEVDAVAMKYGQQDAMNILDQNMQNYVNDHQDFVGDWLWNTGQNIFVGGVANLANNITALGALSARVFYGREGLANYLSGKDASGNGEDNTFLDPQYWNKVDQYNTFSKDYIDKVDKNGGVSKYNNIARAGEETDFGWHTTLEALKMSKFAWSDLLKNVALGKLVNLGAVKLGGQYLSPGVLSAESSLASKAVNKIGSAAVIGASSLGIDMAYGLQTYNDVLAENNQKLDALIDQRATEEAERRMSDPKTMEDFRRSVEEENAKRKAMAKEGEPWFPVDESKAYVDFYNNLKEQIKEETKPLYAEARKEAAKDAADAYVSDATTEFVRMALTNAVFKSWLFDKGTLRAMQNNNRFVDVATKEGKRALGKWATYKEMAKDVITKIWGGFQSNYYDDITVAMAKSFELQDYNNYLAMKYSPSAYGSTVDNFVNPVVASMVGMTESYTDGRSLLDGVVGALGAPFSTAINVPGIISRKTNAKRRNESTARDAKNKVETLKYGVPETISDYISNPVLDALVEAREKTRATQREIARANNSLAKNSYALENMPMKVAVLNKKAVARQGETVLDAEDAKDNELFVLASELLDMKNNYAVTNAQAEPNKAAWSAKKAVSRAINQALTSVAEAASGMDFTQYAESPYSIAMQQLEDAASIENASDEAQQARQENLIDTFLGLEVNKSIAEDKSLSTEQKRTIAAERLQKNATTLLSTMEKMEEISSNLDNSLSAYSNPRIKEQLMYQFAMADRWKERGEELENKNNPESRKTTAPELLAVAKYGNSKQYNKAVEHQRDKVEDLTKQAEGAREALKMFKENKELSDLLNSQQVGALKITAESLEESLKIEKQKLAEMEADSSYFNQQEADGTTVEKSSNELPIISAEDILGLDADSRLQMLDPYHFDDYSPLQQREITAALNMLMANGTSRSTVISNLKDAAVLKHRVEDNAIVADRIMRNPTEANLMLKAFEENRKNAVWDYFNDKIVNEAFNALEKPVDYNEKLATARNFSYSILRGISDKLSAEEKKHPDLYNNMSLKNVKDAVDAVMKEREERQKDSAGFLNFFNRMDTVNVTEEEGTTQKTKEVELSRNDKSLLNYAVDFATEHNIPVEDVIKQDNIQAFKDYVEERNHSLISATTKASPEHWVNMPDQNYLNTLINSTIADYNKYKEKQKKEDAPKVVNTDSEETKNTGQQAAQQAQPQEKPGDEPRPGELEGERKTVADLFAAHRGEQAHKPLTEDDNTLVELTELNGNNYKFKDEIRGLVDYVNNNLPFINDEIKTNIKKTIESLLKGNEYNSFTEFKNKFIETLFNDGLTNYATVLKNADIKPIKETPKAGETDSNAQNAETSIFDEAQSSPNTLTTLDLDFILNTDRPELAHLKEYVKGHNVLAVLNALNSLERRDSKGDSAVRQFPVMFVYDAELARQAMEVANKEKDYNYSHEINSPIVMAIRITNENRGLLSSLYGDTQLKDISSLIKIKVGSTNFYLQPIGIMPASTNNREGVLDTSSKMTKIRSSIREKDGTYPTQIITIPGTNTKMQGNISHTEAHTDYENGVHRTDEPKSVSSLFDENVNNESERIIDNVSKEELDKYNSTRPNTQERRNTDVFKKIKKAFIDRLFTEKKAGTKEEGEDGNRRVLKFRTNKDTRNNFGIPILTKSISETFSKNDPDTSIIKLLENVLNPNNSALEFTIKSLMHSNSRLNRIFDGLRTDLIEDLSKKSKLASGKIDNSGLPKLAEAVQNIITNNLNITDGPEFTARAEGDDAIAVDVKISDNTISTLYIEPGKTPKEKEIARFIANLVLEKRGSEYKVRNSKKGSELIKWQVDYGEAERKQSSDKARKNLEELFDDNIFYVTYNKLSYPANKVVIEMGKRMKAAISATVEREKQDPTSNTVSNTANTRDGKKVDPDTGVVEGKDNKKNSESRPLTDAQKKTIDALNTIAEASRNLEPVGGSYLIEGQKHARVTSVKHLIKGSESGRISEDNAWMLPGSKVGDSFDEFARDVFNEIFKDIPVKERELLFESYANSTARNYEALYNTLLNLKTALNIDGEHLLSTGKDVGTDSYDRGKIVVHGELQATSTSAQGITTTKPVRVAGTVDQIAVNEDGDVIIYDFKTYHSDTFNKDVANKKGYNVQLSLYAKFLEEMLKKMGIKNAKGEDVKVVGIRLIPAHVKYETPIGKDNDGNLIKNGRRIYKQQDENSSQLLQSIGRDESKGFEEFHGADFELKEVISLDRLTDDELNLALERMSLEEKESLLDAAEEQTGGEDVITNQDIENVVVSKKEEETEEDSEDDTENPQETKSRSRLQSLKERLKQQASERQATESIDSEGSVQEAITDQKNNCRM